MLKEFRDFIAKGNVFDMAVGIIIGLAFGAIVTSLVNDVLMPPIGLVLSGIDFSSLSLTLKEGVPNPADPAKPLQPPVVANYGKFINAIISFLIVAFVVFMLVKAINRLKAPPAAPDTHACPQCLSKIPLKATRCAFCTAQVVPA